MTNIVANHVLLTRYVQKDSAGKPIETIDELWRRVARHASKVETTNNEYWENAIYELLSKQYFLFNSPTLVNAGTAINGLSACYVVGMEDSIDGIWATKRNFAKIAQKGGGAGVNLCDTRPKNDIVSGSTHAKAGGPIAWLETLWRDMTAITQAGFRSMACMAVMRVDHPDIEEFITCKNPARALAAQLTTQYNIVSVEDGARLWETIRSAKDLTSEQQKLVKLSEDYLSNFNISVGITDDFMRAVKNDADFNLTFNGKIYRTIKARYLWDLICKNAWESGDPGLMFLDTTNNNSPYKYSGQVIKATNPCGEQGLPANGVCNLGSVDVSKFIKHQHDLSVVFDWNQYIDVCCTATRALNNIVDIGSWPTSEIETWVHDNKPIGLGIMGFADACLALGYRYGDQSSLDFARNLVENMYHAAAGVSVALGETRGVPKACAVLPEPRRNVTLLSIAPTGTISLIAGCSSGCEPVFHYVQIRQDNTGSYVIVHPEIKRKLQIDDMVFDKNTDYGILNNAASKIVKQAKAVMSDIMVSADEISVQDHIAVQAAFQVAWDNINCVDSGVSKTINMPNNATIDDVSTAYNLAYTLNCKGITIYRDGSKSFQILNTVKEEPTTSDFTIVPAKRFKMTYKSERWYVIIGEDVNGNAKEIFTITQNTDDTLATTDAIARMISLALRYNVPVEKVVSQLRKVRQYSVGSFPAMIARVLSNYVKTPEDTTQNYVCTECGSSNVELVGGCPTCKDCGYSKCG